MSDELFNRRLAQALGMIVGIFGIAGLFANGYLWGITNADIVINLFHLVIAATLLYVGFAPVFEFTVANTLKAIGIMFITISVAGIILPTLVGLAPSGLTRFDVFYHLVFGVIATWAGKTTTSHEAM